MEGDLALLEALEAELAAEAAGAAPAPRPPAPAPRPPAPAGGSGGAGGGGQPPAPAPAERPPPAGPPPRSQSLAGRVEGGAFGGRGRKRGAGGGGGAGAGGSASAPWEARGTGVRVRNPVVGRLALEERLSLQDFFKLETLPRMDLEGAANGRMGSWATLGVLKEKSEPKSASGGQKFMCVQLGDLRETTVTLFLFGEAFREHWTQTLGSVVVVLDAKLRRGGRGGSGLGSGEITLSIDRPEQLFRVGVAADMGVCRGVCQSGRPCSMVIDRRQGEYCDYHAVKAFKRLRTQRPSLAGGNLTQPMIRKQEALDRRERQRAGSLSQGVGGPGPKVSRAALARGRRGGAAKGGGGARIQGQKGTVTLPKGIQNVAQAQMAKKGQRPFQMAEDNAEFSEYSAKYLQDLLASKRGSAGAGQASARGIGRVRPSAPSISRASAVKRVRDGSLKLDVPDPNSTQQKQPCQEVPQRALRAPTGTDADTAAALQPLDPIHLPARRTGSGRGGRPSNARSAPTHARHSARGEAQQVSAFGRAFNHRVSDRERHAVSAYAHIADKEEERERQRALGALEEQEQLYLKIQSQTSRKVKRLFCEDCRSYVTSGKAATCRQRRHRIVQRVETLYYFSCSDCGQRETSFQKMPDKACRKCNNGSKRWTPAPLMAEKKVQAAAVASKENFQSRGVEHGFSLRS